MTLVIDRKLYLNETVTLSFTLNCLHYDLQSWGPALYTANNCVQWHKYFKYNFYNGKELYFLRVEADHLVNDVH